MVQGIEQSTGEPGIIAHEEALWCRLPEFLNEAEVKELSTWIGRGLKVKDLDGRTHLGKELAQLPVTRHIHRHAAGAAGGVRDVVQRARDLAVEFVAMHQDPWFLGICLLVLRDGCDGRSDRSHARGKNQSLVLLVVSLVEPE